MSTPIKVVERDVRYLYTATLEKAKYSYGDGRYQSTGTSIEQSVVVIGDVEVTIDVGRIASDIAWFALKNKSGRATKAKGHIKAKVVKRREVGAAEPRESYIGKYNIIERIKVRDPLPIED